MEAMDGQVNEDSAEIKLDDEQLPSSSTPAETNGRRRVCIAVAGCSHGEMDVVYATLAEIERRDGKKADLLISCGDYQAVRNYGDLHHMHVNEKYRQLQTFHKYYSGETIAPVLTLFIGGNHESSGYMAELPNGGWVAPRIYYMGFASVVRFAGLRIAGLSGIYKHQDYNRGHYEYPPFRESGSVISAYHVRSLEIFRLKQLRPMDSDSTHRPLDIMISHDWPCGITNYGNSQRLVKIKPHFYEDIERNQLGNPAGMALLRELKPRYWFAAHLHVKFAAIVPHDNEAAEVGDNPTAPRQVTRFLALDKPIPRRNFLQLIEFEVDDDAVSELSYDPEWLAILRSTNHLAKPTMRTVYMPGPGANSDERWDFRPTQTEMAEISALVSDGDYRIGDNFRRTAPPHRPNDQNERSTPSLYYRNPQSTEFCQRFGITDLNQAFCESNADGLGQPYYLIETSQRDNVDEIPLDDEEDFDGDMVILDRKPMDAAAEPLADFVAPQLTAMTDTIEEPQLTAMTDTIEKPGNGEPEPKMRRRNAALYEIDRGNVEDEDES